VQSSTGQLQRKRLIGSERDGGFFLDLAPLVTMTTKCLGQRGLGSSFGWRVTA
jgi:hypothetical protein